MLKVRKAAANEIDIIMGIYRSAQDFMIASGNPNQWGHNHPAKEQIIDDIEKGICHVIYDDMGICGVFALCTGKDPTYSYIEGGEWLKECEYVTIHRIASLGRAKGIFSCAVDYCRGFAGSIRIDTHEENKVMQRHILSEGFKRCGIIYLENGDPRIAYQWIK